MKLWIGAFLLCGAVVHAAPTPCTHRIRGIFDIGSGATKLDLFEIETCLNGSPPKKTLKLVRIVEDQLLVPVSLEAGKTPNQAIGPQALAKLQSALIELKKKAREIILRGSPSTKEIEFAAIATHAVRTCTNRAEVEKATLALGLPLRILTQDEEGLAGYNGVRAKGIPSACSNKRLLVWDIGGGSMQWTLERSGQPPRQFGLPVGAETYKQKLITKFNLSNAPKCGGESSTPNPIGPSRLQSAGAVATELATDLPADFTTPKDLCLVGIGGVHLSSIDQAITQIFKSLRACACDTAKTCDKVPFVYSTREVACLAEHLSSRDDCDPEIKGSFSTTNVSNLFLVSGFLRALHQDKVRVINVNGGHGFALDQSQLKFQTMDIGG